MRWLLLFAIAGCYERKPLQCETDNCQVPDGSATEVCVGDPAGLLPRTCFDPMPAPRTITAAMSPIETDLACDLPVVDHPKLCILAGESIVIEGVIKARGGRPLVLWSATTIELLDGAEIDVKSEQVAVNEELAAGADDSTCPSLDGALNNLANPFVGAGGCGGGFGGAGGLGGDGARSPVTVGPGCASMIQPLDRVRGGCRGGHGGLSNAASELNGGSSGGAVYLMAGQTIVIRGVIDARGDQGLPATGNPDRLPGGGGGGSGGLIAFDTPELVLDGAVLNALGGGGSSGMGLDPQNSALIQGLNGIEALLDPPTPATRTAATISDNFGGAGTVGDGLDGGDAGGGQRGGGGGGAGGVGYIVLYPGPPQPAISALVVPPFLIP